ncbi:hypothetical protein [Bacteroides reticulotermitis]|uniref:hypothetical protein n=1 Tax=Bacteroides reticulotermitis TaxID=1133319 RepID=UPI003A8A7C61
MKRLHHYTSIDTLEVILKNKNIKFNRLDLVDDKAEYKHDSLIYDIKIKLGKYTFASCWTRSDVENIDLWNRYGKNNRGIRLTLDEDMFITNDVGTVRKSFFLEREVYFENFYISSYINDVCVKDTIYVEDIIPYYQNAIMSVGPGVVFSHDNIGLYKKREWALQEESRFIIHAIPFTRSLLTNHPLSLPEAVGDAYRNQTELCEKALFIPLRQEALNNIRILMGPLSTEQDKKRVESLLDKFNIKIQIQDSVLKGDLHD